MEIFNSNLEENFRMENDFLKREMIAESVRIGAEVNCPGSIYFLPSGRKFKRNIILAVNQQILPIFIFDQFGFFRMNTAMRKLLIYSI